MGIWEVIQKEIVNKPEISAELRTSWREQESMVLTLENTKTKQKTERGFCTEEGGTEERMKDIVREMLLRLDDVDEWRRKLAMLKLIQAALDIKLDQRQKQYALSEIPAWPAEGRRTGKTLANVIKILINEKETIGITRDSAWRYTDDNRFGYAYVWEQAKILKMISDKLREKDVPVPEVKLIGLW